GANGQATHRQLECAAAARKVRSASGEYDQQQNAKQQYRAHWRQGDQYGARWRQGDQLPAAGSGRTSSADRAGRASAQGTADRAARSSAQGTAGRPSAADAATQSAAAEKRPSPFVIHLADRDDDRGWRIED